MLEAAVYLLFIYEPVAKRAVVAVSVTEPAVVHYQHFNAQLRSLLCDVDKLFGVEIEVGRFPVVDEDRTALVLIFASDNVLSVQVMECAGHLADTLVGVNHNDLGSGKFLSWLQLPGEVKVVDTHNEACFLVLSYLCLGKEVAAVNKVEAVSLAHILVRIVGNKCGKGVILVGGLTLY